MVPRTISSKLLELFKKFPVVTITGPRQSGKSTLVQASFPHLPYVNLEDLNTFEFAREDPISFIKKYSQGAIIDEAQRVPELFSAIQILVDKTKKNSHFVLSGSQNFLLLEKISQSLAGRTAILHLLPFSLKEIAQTPQRSLEEHLFLGGYPRLHTSDVPTTTWLDSYIQTYVERDVRTIKNITDLNTFRRFIRMCAARSGMLLDLTSIGSDCGISHNTARAWLSVLEASFIVYLLQPHFQNFNKRLIKSPKIYFYDTGLLCALLGIKEADELSFHAMRGAIFETFVIGELQKHYYHCGQRPPLYFWSDKRHEIDCLLEDKGLIPIEIKSGGTIKQEHLRGLRYWMSLAQVQRGGLIYGGSDNQERSGVKIQSWHSLKTPKKLIDSLRST